MPATGTMIATGEENEKRARTGFVRASAVLAAGSGFVALLGWNVTKHVDLSQFMKIVSQIDEFWVKVVTLPAK